MPVVNAHTTMGGTPEGSAAREGAPKPVDPRDSTLAIKNFL